jgi:hypothetical protein
VDGIPPSLRGSVDVFVASSGILTLALVLSMWESLLELTLHFLFCENPFCMVLGLEFLLLGLHTHMEE